MNTTELLRLISEASESSLTVYVNHFEKLKSDRQIDGTLKLMFEAKITGRKAQIAHTKLFAQQIKEAVNAMPLLGRIEEAVIHHSISEGDHLQLQHFWMMRKEEIAA